MFVALLLMSLGIGQLSANPPRYFGVTDPEVNHVYHAIGKFICIVCWVGVEGFLFLFGGLCSQGGVYLPM